MEYYLATSLGNRAEAIRMIDELDKLGWGCTYPWARWHGSLQGQPEVWQQKATQEIEGVREAELVIALMPGGRGTHVEIGAALALDKPVHIIGRDASYDYECVFHHHPFAHRWSNTQDFLDQARYLS